MTNPDEEAGDDMTAEEEEAVARLRSHFAQTPGKDTLDGAKALFALRDPDAILAEWSQQAELAVRSAAALDEETVLHFSDGGSELSVMVSAGRLDGAVAPTDAAVLVEEIGGAVHEIEVDAAGGFSLNVTGLVRLRVVRDGVADILTDVVSVPR